MRMFDQNAIVSFIETEGYAVQGGILSKQEVEALIQATENPQDGGNLLRHGRVFAVRNLLDLPEISKLAESDLVRNLAQAVLDERAFPVRGILFDKVPEANWKVPWHQDVTIAVQERKEIEGFGPWSTKAGILHVQPPAPVLERMISIRLHLDECDESNGALRVIPGSHRLGRIAEADIPTVLAQSPQRVCSVQLGGALVMRPLLLHASSPSDIPVHRRVIHLDFASEHLPFPLKWLTEPEAIN
jgi:ectoine hydroxylase-related dioxygenase (phytanoyl-CoA dioxygenase family)